MATNVNIVNENVYSLDNDMQYVVKSFRSFDEAKIFAENHPKLRIWVEMFNGNHQQYWVASVNRFAREYLNRDYKQFFSEIIDESLSCKLYIDLFFLKKHNPLINAEDKVPYIVNSILETLANNYNINSCFEDVAILDASDKLNFRHRLIFTGVVFNNITECKKFVESFCEKNKFLVNIQSDNGKLINLCNMNVYSNGHAFCIWKSYNYGETPLKIARLDRNFESWESFKIDDNDKETAPLNFFMASLVTTDQEVNMPNIDINTKKNCIQ